MASSSSTQEFYNALLRPTVLHIFRAAGFHSMRSSVLDTAVDLTARFLILLGERTLAISQSNTNLSDPSITDARMAMEEVGFLVPLMSATEEAWLGKEDLRGVTAFIEWCKSDQFQTIKRMAGMDFKEGARAEVGGLGDGEDFLAALKKKTGKAGDETRYAGTVLGDPDRGRPVKIEGADVNEIGKWGEFTRQSEKAPVVATYASSESVLSSPPEEFEDDPMSDLSDPDQTKP